MPVKPRAGSSPDDPTIRMVRMIYAGFMQQGLDPHGVMVGADIEPMKVAEGQDRIPAVQLARAFELATEQAGPDFGLVAAQSVDYRMFARLSGSSEYLMMEAMLHQRTVESALERLARYSRLGYGAGGFRFSRRPAGISVTFELGPGLDRSRPVNDFMAVMAYQSLKQRTEHPLASARFTFRHEAPVDFRRYRELLGEQLTFGAEKNELLLSYEDAERPLTMHQPGVLKALEVRAEEELRKMTAPRSFADRVRRALPADASKEPYSANRIAKKLGVSLRTMRRKLLLDEVSYQQLVDEHRAQWAEHYLREQGLSVSECAERLGFAGTSAFHRAFRRWYGRSPAEHRAGEGSR